MGAFLVAEVPVGLTTRAKAEMAAAVLDDIRPVAAVAEDYGCT